MIKKRTSVDKPVAPKKTAKRQSNEFYALQKEFLDEFFDLSRYDDCATLDAVGWSSCLYLRFLIWNLDEPPISSNDLSKDSPQDLSLQFFRNPIVAPERRRPLHSPAKYQSIYDVSIFDAWCERETMEEFKPEAVELCKALHNAIESNVPSDEWPDAAQESRHEFDMRCNQHRYSTVLPWVIVDLGSTDEQLHRDFSEWLKKKRAKTRSLGIGSPASEFTKADFQRWHKLRVLAFIDLLIWSKRFSIPMSDAAMGRAIFPDDEFGDRTERIRKTVRPLAMWLLDGNVQQALDQQAGSRHGRKR